MDRVSFNKLTAEAIAKSGPTGKLYFTTDKHSIVLDGEVYGMPLEGYADYSDEYNFSLGAYDIAAMGANSVAIGSLGSIQLISNAGANPNSIINMGQNISIQPLGALYYGAVSTDNEVIKKSALNNALVPYATQTWVENKGYLTQHQSLANYPTIAQMNSAISTATNDMATKTWVGQQGFLKSFTETDPIFSASAAAGITSSNITAWNNKQDAISDLETIRSGAALGATALQEETYKGTVTSVAVKMNGTTKGTITSSGTIDLGTVITAHQDISGKQDAISDLETIRSGAALGATALQEETYKGTVTSVAVKMNGATKGTITSSGTIDLGTVITAHQDISGKADIEDIPTTTSQLTNDSGFITNAVNDLANYYLKSQTYTKDEVDELISVIKQFEVVVADVLPTASASTMGKMYLIPNSGHPGNVKDEFITLENSGTYSWEKIGSTEISLDGYATEDWVNQQGYLKEETYKGTVTSVAVKMNGATKGTITSSGTIDLGTVITAHQDISGKQDTISDLETIRSGAALGATALQEETYKGTVTSVAVKMNGATKGTVTSSGTIDLGTVITAHQDISGKQDTISDLETIRTNASNGAAAYTALGGHTVAKDVPADAVFTDTIYDDTEIRDNIEEIEKVAATALTDLRKDIDDVEEVTSAALTDLRKDIDDLDEVTATALSDLNTRINYAEQDISYKQNALVSGENIKTINGESILGSGDIEIDSGGEGFIVTSNDADTAYNIALDWTKNPEKLSTVDGSKMGQVMFGASNTSTNSVTFAVGMNNTVSGTAATALGAYGTSAGSASLSEGQYTEATGNSSHAEGGHSKATGGTSHAEGERTQATNSASHAEGIETIASGQAAHSEGAGNTASGNYSHVGGINSVASGSSSFVQGQYAYATQPMAVALGAFTVAGGQGSFASGVSTSALGESSVAMTGSWVGDIYLTGDAGATTYTYTASAGEQPDFNQLLCAGNCILIQNGGNAKRAHIVSVDTTNSTITLTNTISADAALSGTHCQLNATVAKGSYSLAARGVAVGNSSWAINRGCMSLGTSSLATGEHTITRNTGEASVGKYNKSTSNTSTGTMFSVGIGSGESNRKNALEVSVNGNVYAYNLGGYNGTNYSSAQPLQTVIGGKQDALVSGTNIKTINNESILGSGNITVEAENEIVYYHIWDTTFTYTNVVNDIMAGKLPILVGEGNLCYNIMDKSIFEEYMDEYPVIFWGAIPNMTEGHNPADLTSILAVVLNPDDTYDAKVLTFQEVLQSGTNIKTINNESILGSGNITIQGGGSEYTAGTNIDITNNVISTKNVPTTTEMNSAIGTATTGMATQTWVNNQGFLKNYTETDPVFSASAAAGITSGNISTWNGKQDAISDLATIRSGAALGATALQEETYKGTVTSVAVKMNGATKGTITSSGTIDLGTVITAHQDISGKQDTISDLATIRSGAALGATALQEETYKGTVTSVAVKMNGTTKGTVTSSGTIDLGTVITAHQDISGKQDTISDLETIRSGAALGATALQEETYKGTVTSVAVKMNGTTKGTITSSGTIDLGTVITAHQDISGKQDTISDLATIRSGAALGATALQTHQSIKTVNGNTITGTGNVSVGTVTSVGITAGTGIEVSGSPVTTSGNITVGLPTTIVGSTTRTSVSSIPVTHRAVLANISANSTLSFASLPADGFEVHVIIHNTGSNTISVTLPSSGSYVCTSESTIYIAAGKYGEANVVTIGSTGYVHGINSI